MSDLVLVTGASGFLAQHIILRLLASGYRVRGTLRSLTRAEEIRQTLAKAGADTTQLEFAAADLMSPTGWAAAMEGVRFVQHVASPFPPAPPKDENELIEPARQGAKHVFEAALAAHVERFVFTSSVAAILYGHDGDPNRVFDERDFTNPRPGVGAYEKSKTIAEKLLWQLHKDAQAGGSKMELVVLNPGLLLGPVLSNDFSTSGEIIKRLLAREIPGCPDIGWAVVDVRDVADAHLKAMEERDAAQERFILATNHATVREMARVLDNRFAKRGYRIPTLPIPGPVMRIVGLFDAGVRLALPFLGKRQNLSSQKAHDKLEFRPRSLETMVVDMAESMIAQGVVK